WGSRALVGFLPRNGRPALTELTPDATVLAFTMAAAILTALVFGLVPAWRAVRVDAGAAIQPGGRGIAEGYSRFGVGKTLVVAQVALSLVMVAGAGPLLGSWRRLVTVDPGFRSRGVVLVSANARPA